MTRYLLLFDSYGLVIVGHPLWREDGSVFCICCWPFPAQSFSGPCPLGLATKFYCLRLETSHFVAFYDSQSHGGSIQPRLHTGWGGGYRVVFSYSVLYLLGVPNRGHRVEQYIPPLSWKRHLHCLGDVCNGFTRHNNLKLQHETTKETNPCGNASTLYLGDTPFESWPGDMLSWVRAFVIFLSTSSQSLDSILNYTMTASFQILS
jgi:hypothetical protein